MLKIFASEALWTVIYDTMQIFGGRSLFTDQPLERMMRDARLNMIGEGSNDVLRAFIGGVGLREVGLDLKTSFEGVATKGKSCKSITHLFSLFIKWMKGVDIPINAPILQKEKRQLSRAINKFSKAIGKLLIYYREGVAEKQMELARVADMAINLYTVSAVLSKLDASIKGTLITPHLEQDIASGKYYCEMAFNQIEALLKGLFSSSDKSLDKLSDLITGLGKR
jgi:hypothetical protein